MFDVCPLPQAVRTAMTRQEAGVASVDDVMEPEVLAESVVTTMDKKSF